MVTEQGNGNREDVFFPVPVRDLQYSLARQIRQSRPASASWFSTLRRIYFLGGGRSIETQFGEENGPAETNRSARGVCIGTVLRVQSKLSRARHAHSRKKLQQDVQHIEKNAKTKATKFRGTRGKYAK